MACSHHSTNKQSFSHLTVYQRGQIKGLREQGLTFQSIADVIGCYKTTVSLEWPSGLSHKKTHQFNNVSKVSARFLKVRRSQRKQRWTNLMPCLSLSVENWCNILPRKILGYRTSQDLYNEELKKTHHLIIHN